MVSELRITVDEAKAFVEIVKTGKMDASRLATALGWEKQRAEAAEKSLVEKGMAIEITLTEVESLHPRFAITNRYRRMCAEEGREFKKNLLIDNIGIVLEKPYED